MVNKKQRNGEIRLILQELRRIIKRSDLNQREVEDLAGFSRGYLSQLLAGNLDLKVWHVLSVLKAFQIPPGEFFGRIYPARPPVNALEEFAERSMPVAEDLDQALATLYRVGIESLSDLRQRLERCERALAELEAQGLLTTNEAVEA
jgi:transcriptional regulator with XRE-family HTH domain